MRLRTAPETYAQQYQQARRTGLIEESDNSVIFIDLDVLDDRLDHLREVFPTSTAHAPAIKAHPLLATLTHIADRGFGLEAASLEEVALAIRAGVPPEKIVFDSPVKTPAELSWCQANVPGLTVNANSLKELSRLQAFPALRAGLRINPLIDSGAPAAFQVSGHGSKFGVPISRRDEILQACLDFPFVRGLHLHAGSEISRLEANARAIAAVHELAREIDFRRESANIGRSLEFIDIGGGYPARYLPGEQKGLETYIALIRKHAPGLLERYQTLTEFGRFVFAHCGWLWSRIEYVLPQGGNTPDTLLLHAGADLFVREIYMSNPPRHQFFALDGGGRLKTGRTHAYDLAGPLCFAGDFLGRSVALPEIKPSDQLIVADVGANSFSLWSRHCSRRFPKVIGYSEKKGEMRIFRKRESLEDVIRFWGME